MPGRGSRRVLQWKGISLSVTAVNLRQQPSPDAKPNLNAILDSNPQFVRSVKNGKLYMAGSGDDAVPIVHVWGLIA